MNAKRLLGYLLIMLLALPTLAQTADNNCNHRYKVAACDWMMLKRQKIGSFKLMKDLKGDGVEMDVGGLGTRDTFDNKFHQTHFQKLFKETALEHSIEVPSVAMSGFYGQSFLTHRNYKALVEDCLTTMRIMGARVAYLPLGGIKEDWANDLVARKELVKRLHVAGEMAYADGAVIGIRTHLSAKEEIKLLKEIDSKGVKIYYSFQNAVEYGRDICKELRTLGKDRICQIHCSNTDGVTLDKDHAIDMITIKKTLDKMGWSGWLVVERSRNKDEVRDVKKNFGTNIHYLKTIFQSTKTE